MKLGDIKIEALKLMNACQERDISPADLDQMANEEDFRPYLLAMPGAINRCFADLEEKRILPIAVTPLRDGEPVVGGMRFDIGEKDIERITYRDISGGYIESHPFLREGDSILIEGFDEGGEYRLLYRPALKPVTMSSDDEADLPIPDRIAVWIPQFIKGDLYRGDEPDEAAAARNLYEQQMAQIAATEAERSGKIRLVKSVYDFSEV